MNFTTLFYANSTQCVLVKAVFSLENVPNIFGRDTDHWAELCSQVLDCVTAFYFESELS